MSTKFFTSTVLSTVLLVPVAFAMELPENNGFVTDAASLFSASQEETLEEDLQRYSTETSNELTIVTIPSLQGESIADVALQIGREWGVGTKENNNGLVFIVARDDHQVFIATGYGLEGVLPDIAVKEIIENAILPSFRKAEYYDGITNGISSIKQYIAGEYSANPLQKSEKGGGASWNVLFIIVFFLMQWFIAILARTKSWWLGGVIGFIIGVVVSILSNFWFYLIVFTLFGLVLDYIVSRNYKRGSKTSWWAGGGWGPGGGGGFGGFGGGSFGGGGAGGSW